MQTCKDSSKGLCTLAMQQASRALLECSNSTPCVCELKKVCTGRVALMLKQAVRCHLLDLALSFAGQGVVVTSESACVPCTLLPASWSGSTPVCPSLNAGCPHATHLQ